MDNAVQATYNKFLSYANVSPIVYHFNPNKDTWKMILICIKVTPSPPFAIREPFHGAVSYPLARIRRCKWVVVTSHRRQSRLVNHWSLLLLLAFSTYLLLAKSISGSKSLSVKIPYLLLLFITFLITAVMKTTLSRHKLSWPLLDTFKSFM